MDIFINKNPVAFSLSGEKMAIELIEALSSLARSQDLFMCNIFINQEEYFYPSINPSLAQYPIQSIKTLSVEFISMPAFAALLSIDAAVQLSIFKKPMDEAYLKTHAKQAKEKLEWIKTVFKQTGAMLHMQAEFAPMLEQLKELERMLYSAERVANAWNEDASKRSILVIENLLSLYMLRFQTKAFVFEMNKLLKPTDAKPADAKPADAKKNLSKASLPAISSLAGDALTLLKTAEGCLSKTAESFQAGREKEALTRLVDLSDSLSMFLHWLEKTLDSSFQQSLDSVATTTALHEKQEMFEKLQIISQALEHADYSELSDLLEYELAPILQSLGNACRKIFSAETTN